MKMWKKTIGILGIVGCCVVGALFGTQEKVYASSVNITISAVGDCTLGSDYKYNNLFVNTYKDKGPDYFLKNVKSVFLKDDLTIANFEGVLTTRGARADKTFAFKGEPEYTKILTGSGVDAVNLANNHSYDYGSGSFSDTKKYLNESGVLNFAWTKTVVKKIKGVKVGMVGLSTLRGDREAELKKAITAVKNKGAELIIVSIHWGNEGYYEANSLQKQLGKAAVDYGADLVLGHHPHVLQGIETYKGKYIVYSLGNFCFGGNSNPKDKDTMIFQQTFTVTNNKKIKNGGINIIPCSLSGVSNRNDFSPILASGKEKTRILDKIKKMSSL